MLWNEKLRLNTVHVKDLVRAMWHLRDHSDTKNGDIFNLCDKGDTSAGYVGHVCALTVYVQCVRVKDVRACSTCVYGGTWGE